MALHWFHPPVNIETDRPGLTYGCNNVEGAATELMKLGQARTQEACMACLGGEGTPDDVRKALEAAAKEEGLLRSSG
ncbi:MAG: DUF982 domain-containing protein [Mesorhizobium sp.]|nr:MAG: DUF982 domain-containing protein [Mesorhizobium sp.]